MSVEIIQQRLLNYQCQTVLEQENALKEIAQEVALMALSRSGFFQKAAFQGGTCLRILYTLPRFSEDLDFILEKPDPHFSWDPYVIHMQDEFQLYGYTLEVVNKNKLEKAVRTAFLKAQSTGGILIIKDRTQQKKLQIKLEIDTHPPQGSAYELKYLDFPLPFGIKTQDLPSLFAGKIHALLFRPYVKGRDWYDFIWYVSLETKINMRFLNAALQQHSPDLTLDAHDLLKSLKDKINQINWTEAQKDIARFLKQRELATLSLWSREFFLSRIDKMHRYLQ